MRWLSLRELYGPAHRWPNGQASYLYAYERPQHTRSQDTVDMNAMAEHAMNPSDVVQGNVGNCYFLSAVATAVSDVAVRRQLIDATFEAAGIYGVSFFLREGGGWSGSTPTFPATTWAAWLAAAAADTSLTAAAAAAARGSPYLRARAACTTKRG